jgi:hypothetical protein
MGVTLSGRRRRGHPAGGLAVALDQGDQAAEGPAVTAGSGG